MRRIALLLALAALTGCGGSSRLTTVPSNFSKPLDEALRRLHDAGLRASFAATDSPCGNGLPSVSSQDPRAPARVRRGTTVEVHAFGGPIPSPAVPIHHAKWTTVPELVGAEFTDAMRRLDAVWPCVHVRAASSTTASRIFVIAQRPRAGTRVPAYGVRVGRGFRPTTVSVTVAAR